MRIYYEKVYAREYLDVTREPVLFVKASRFMERCNLDLSVSAIDDQNGTSNYLVLLDDEYEKLPVYVQRFIINHEVGHILNSGSDKSKIHTLKNLEKLSSMNTLKTTTNYESDRIADIHASMECGYWNTIRALRYIKREYGIPGINKRIKSLIKWIIFGK